MPRVVELLTLFKDYADLRVAEANRRNKKDNLIFGISYLSKLNEKAKEINPKYFFTNIKNTFFLCKKEDKWDRNVNKFVLRRTSIEKDFKLIMDNMHILIEYDVKLRGYVKDC